MRPDAMRVVDRQTEQTMLPRDASPHPKLILQTRGATTGWERWTGVKERRQLKEGHRFINTAHSDTDATRMKGPLAKRTVQRVDKHQS